MFKKSFLFTVLAIAACWSSASFAQFNSNNVQLRSWIDLSTFGASSGNDCWGYVAPSGREYALMGLNNKAAFVEITDPSNVDWFASIPHTSSTWCDIKVYRDHAYIVTMATTGIQVVDLSDIDNHNVTLVRTVSSPLRNHNVALDTTSGFLYTCGSRNGSATTVIFDLTDPANPVEVGTWAGASEHDAQIVTFEDGPNAGRQILFGASESRGLDVIDVTNKSNVFLVSRTAYPNVSYCHQVWTEDGHYLYINDELDSIARTTVFDISDINSPVHLGDFSSGLPATDHNNYVKDGFLFCANYRSGLRIFDLNTHPVNPPQVGFFDTYPENDASGFDGAWSNFPFFPSGTVIVSDINRGLFVLDPSKALEGRLRFDYPNGRPDFVHPAGGTSMIVEVAGTSEDVQPQPGTGLLHVDTGNGFEALSMNDLGNNRYEAVFPASTCGSVVNYFVSAESTAGDQFTDPTGAPDTFFSAVSGSGFDIIFADDFETDQGWTVVNENLTSGAWERAIPAGGEGRQGPPPADYDGSGRCYVTGNAAGDCDVDGGPTRLISPLFNLRQQPDAIVSYARWFFNDDNDADRLSVEVSNDGGTTWTLVESVGNTGGWTTHSFRVGDFINPTRRMRLRFNAVDNPNNSVTEAAIDAVEVATIQCESFATLTDLAILDGTLVAGGLPQLEQSDDSFLEVEARVTAEVHQPHLLRMQIGAQTEVQNASTLNLTLESKITDVEASVWLFLRDWNTGDMVQVDQFTVGMEESVHQVEVANAGRFVREGDGRIELEIKEIVFFPFTLGGFHALFDHLVIGVR